MMPVMMRLKNCSRNDLKSYHLTAVQQTADFILDEVPMAAKASRELLIRVFAHSRRMSPNPPSLGVADHAKVVVDDVNDEAFL